MQAHLGLIDAKLAWLNDPTDENAKRLAAAIYVAVDAEVDYGE